MRIHKGISLLIASIFILSSCLPPPISETPEAISNRCLPPEDIDSYCQSIIPDNPIHIFVFIQGTPRNPEYFKAPLTIMSKVFQEVIEPNDWIIMAWMEYSSLEQAIIFNSRVGEVPPPVYPVAKSTPTIFSPIITPQNTAIGGLLGYIQTTQAQETADAVKATSTKMANDIYCDQIKRIEECKLLSSKYQETRQSSIDDFLKNYSYIINKEYHPIEKMQIYEALDQASSVLNNYCTENEFSKCVLIIFSDMVDWRKSTPEDVNVDLEMVDVFIIMQDCTILNPSDCKNRVTLWKYLFSEYSSDPIFIPNDNIVIDLIEYLER